LRWANIQFDRGANGEIEVLTQKRGKIAIIPLSTELRNALEEVHQERKPHGEDHVVFNPDTGIRSKIAFDCRCVRGRCAAAPGQKTAPRATCSPSATEFLRVAKMLADTVETVEKHYAQFIPAARNAVQVNMDNGIAIRKC
jgi:integrase